MSLYETPLAATIESLQDAGRDVWVWGFTADGRFALVADADNNAASVAYVESTGSLGRWECTLAHLHDFVEVYWRRFPNRG